MTRTAWLLVLAILASNAAWVLVGTRPTQAVRPGATSDRESLLAARARVRGLEISISRLQEELPAHRANPQEAVPTQGQRAPESDPQTPHKDLALAETLRKRWVRDAFQSTDPLLRQTTLDTIYSALGSEERARTLGALHAVIGLRSLKYARTRYRLAILPILKSKDPELRAAALQALYFTGPDPSDRERVFALARDPKWRVRAVAGSHLGAYCRRDVTDPEATIVVANLLEDPDKRVVKRAIDGLGGTKLPDVIEKRLLALFETDIYRRGVVNAIGSQYRKSSPVVNALLRALGDRHTRGVAEMAAWWLHTGVPKSLWPKVADRVMDLVLHMDEGDHHEYFNLLGLYGGTSQVPILEKLLESPKLTDLQRREVKGSITAIQSRQKG